MNAHRIRAPEAPQAGASGLRIALVTGAALLLLALVVSGTGAGHDDDSLARPGAPGPEPDAAPEAALAGAASSTPGPRRELRTAHPVPAGSTDERAHWQAVARDIRRWVENGVVL